MVTLNTQLRIALVAAFLLVAWLSPRAAFAQNAKEATTIQIGAPAQLNLGESGTLQALLVDSAGKPIPKAAMYFVTPATFLSSSGDVVVAQAITNKNGQAVAEFENSVETSITLRAEFRGDERYAPSDATAQISIVGDQQVYVEHVGVHIPGLNEAPPAPVSASLKEPLMGVTLDIIALWPSMSGWPVALALMTVWGLYVVVVALIFRIAASGQTKNRGYNIETGRFE